VDLMSIDPKEVDDIFKGKHWNPIGKKSIKGGDPQSNGVDQDWKFVSRAMNNALAATGPAVAADVFKPRLAISARIPVFPAIANGPSRNYVFLMSFDCRLAKLYIDAELQGCYGINNLAGADQILNNILVAAGQQLKPKSAAPSN
jgi:hypothetical protein